MKIEIRSPIRVERSASVEGDTLIEVVKARVEKHEPKIRFMKRVKARMGNAMKNVAEELLKEEN